MFLLYIFFGIFSGYFAGFLGIGAGVMLMPIFSFMGVPYNVAVDASIMAVFLSSLTSSIQHYKNNDLNFEPIIIAGIPGAITALIGSVYLIHIIPSQLLQLIFAGLMFLNIDLLRISGHNQPALHHNETPKHKKFFFHYVFIGILSGLMSSLLGIGGGLLIVSLLITMAGFGMKDAVKTSIAIMVITTFSSLSNEIYSYTLPLEIGIPASIGAIFGSFLGSIALNYVKVKSIKIMNYFVSFFLGIIMLIKLVLM